VLGIRVVPEVDSPGHVESWARALDSDMRINCGISTVLNPVSAKVDRFIDELIGELAEIFPSKEFHIGAHEL
jgi:N-acetyl-beta-hexosaminidase